MPRITRHGKSCISPAASISQGSALDDLVARGDIAVVSHRACVFAGIPVDCVRAVAVFTTGIGTGVFVLRPEQAVARLTSVGEGLHLRILGNGSLEYLGNG